MNQILAYFITWTTYGTWLPGDKRGWVSNKDGTSFIPYNRPNKGLLEYASDKMCRSPIRLSQDQQHIVVKTINESCRIKGWKLYALAVLSNHVQIVLQTGDISPENVMKHLKAYASRALNNVTSSNNRRWWTRHGSTRYLKTQQSLENAVTYVQNQ